VLVLGDDCKESNFGTEFKLEEKACGNFWHKTVYVKQNDEEIGRFVSLCPSWNGDVKLEIDDNEVAYSDKKTAFRWVLLSIYVTVMIISLP